VQTALRDHRGLRVGIVSPYSWDYPGGVQQHIRDLTESLTGLGHQVSVIAPCDEKITAEYPYLTSAGRAVPVPYNGSVARMCFGPLSAAKVKQWLEDGDFDLVHVHELTTPSTSLIATWMAECPVVGTFHAALGKSRVLSAAAPILQSALEKVSVRIAVSEAARESLTSHVGGNCILIPNGVNVEHYRQADPPPGWPRRSFDGKGRTIGFLGRLDDNRKGLPVLLSAFNAMAEHDPDLRLLVVGPGDEREARRKVETSFQDRVHFTGMVSEAEKISALHAMDVYCAPNLGGESFGIVLTEAMASSAPVIASDIDAFRAVLRDGAAGELFTTGDTEDLAKVTLRLLADGGRRQQLSSAALEAVQAYDWRHIAAEVAAVYDAVTHPATAG
jgi:phosphatidyl-myo-inositol alpha-mannosyltransferase